MQSQNQDPTFVLDEKTRQEREEKGQILKHEDELQDISNMDLSKFKQNKTDQLMEKSKELRGKAEEQINDFKSKICEKSGNFKEGGAQKENEFVPKGQELKQKAQNYSAEKASEIKKDIKEETSSKYENKRTIEHQIHHGEKRLTEKTKHDILELTEKLTEKIQALKQVDQRAQSGATPSSQEQTQSLEQSYSGPQQEKLESQPSGKNQETKFEHNKEEQPKSSSLEQNQSQRNEQKQEESQVQEVEEQHEERKPLVDQVLGRIHSASDNLHHKVDDFKNALKVEEPNDTERVPLIDKLAHSIHNVTDRITGVFKHKAKPTKSQNDESYKYHSSKSLPEKQPVGEIGSSFQEQEGIGEGGIGSEFRENIEEISKPMESALQEKNFGEEFGSYLIGSEFRENLEGFTKTMENALQEEGEKSFGGNEYNLGRFELEQKCGLSTDRDFKIQEAEEFRQERSKERSELKPTEQEEKPILSVGRSSASSEDQSTWASRGSDILRKIEEDIEMIDRLLEKSIQKGSKPEQKGVDASSSPRFEKLQGFGNLSNQSAEIGINTKDDSALTRQIYHDVNANDKLIEGAILGEKSEPKESSESSATNLYSQSSKSRTEVFRDITNEAAGSISQKAEKDLTTNDKLLDKKIREGKSDYRVEPEDKENIGKKGPSMSGANFSHCDGIRDLVQTL